eukprot:scaffold9464_cov29-Phaeocystis_antarctica.AAC.2
MVGSVPLACPARKFGGPADPVLRCPRDIRRRVEVGRSLNARGVGCVPPLAHKLALSPTITSTTELLRRLVQLFTLPAWSVFYYPLHAKLALSRPLLRPWAPSLRTSSSSLRSCR